MDELSPSPIKIEAVVSMSGGEALVLNRDLQFRYERFGNDLQAQDGIFRACYRYERPQGRWKAFAGRQFDIPMVDGTVERANGQWWHAGIEGTVSVAHATKQSLLKCYVFYGGALADPQGLSELRASYTGDVYPYWAYEAFIKLPVERLKMWERVRKLERANTHILSNLRKMKAEMSALKVGAA